VWHYYGIILNILTCVFIYLFAIYLVLLLVTFLALYVERV